MYGRMSTVEFEAQTITNAGGDRDLFYIAPADDKPCVIWGWYFCQFSDVGDAAEEMLRLRLIRGHTTVGSGGAAATPGMLLPGDTAAGYTARTNDTTIASAGTAVNLISGGFNIRSGEIFWLPERVRPHVTQAQGSIVLRLMAAPTDDVTLSGTLFVEEQG